MGSDRWDSTVNRGQPCRSPLEQTRLSYAYVLQLPLFLPLEQTNLHPVNPLDDCNLAKKQNSDDISPTGKLQRDRQGHDAQRILTNSRSINRITYRRVHSGWTDYFVL